MPNIPHIFQNRVGWWSISRSMIQESCNNDVVIHECKMIVLSTKWLSFWSALMPRRIRIEAPSSLEFEPIGNKRLNNRTNMNSNVIIAIIVIAFVILVAICGYLIHQGLLAEKAWFRRQAKAEQGGAWRLNTGLEVGGAASPFSNSSRVRYLNPKKSQNDKMIIHNPEHLILGLYLLV